jgi:hypothetical protein
MSEPHRLPPIEVFAIDTIEQLAGVLPRRTPWFTLLLIWDAPDFEPTDLAGVFRPLVDSGLAYLCTWGQGCEEVHDAVDLAVVQKEAEQGELPYVLMSTWHSDEPLGEALRFFSAEALPSDAEVFANCARYAVTVGSQEHARRLRQALLRLGISSGEMPK